MEETLEKLEARRRSLYQKLEAIGDFRRGTISVNYRQCGKKNCICTKPGHPGHGPQYLWNTTLKGKSYAKNVKFGPELQKYIDEIGNYRHFLRLCEEVVQVSEKICDVRPVGEIEDQNEREELKKKLQGLFKKRLRRKWTGS
ncbi:MAG: hypothetical protein Q8P64_11595 [Deltaproteobacteria bacterium]|nr:hypothetical protein [Deltaproteobacteria bacterium]